MRPFENRGMRNLAFRHIVVFAAAVSVGLLVADAQGQTITSQGSDVKAMFASQSETYKDSDPPSISWGIAGAGPYSPGPLLNLPPAPGASIVPPSGGNPFAGILGGHASYFNDGAGTTATSVIADYVAGSPSLTSDIRISIPYWQLNQGSSGTGYAYEQLNFGSNYLFTNNTNGLQPSALPNLPIYINGSVASGSTAYAQFYGEVDYTWLPVTYNSFTGVVSSNGSPVPLGSLTTPTPCSAAAASTRRCTAAVGCSPRQITTESSPSTAICGSPATRPLSPSHRFPSPTPSCSLASVPSACSATRGGGTAACHPRDNS